MGEMNKFHALLAAADKTRRSPEQEAIIERINALGYEGANRFNYMWILDLMDEWDEQDWQEPTDLDTAPSTNQQD